MNTNINAVVDPKTLSKPDAALYMLLSLIKSINVNERKYYSTIILIVIKDWQESTSDKEFLALHTDDPIRLRIAQAILDMRGE